MLGINDIKLLYASYLWGLDLSRTVCDWLLNILKITADSRCGAWGLGGGDSGKQAVVPPIFRWGYMSVVGRKLTITQIIKQDNSESEYWWRKCVWRELGGQECTPWEGTAWFDAPEANPGAKCQCEQFAWGTGDVSPVREGRRSGDCNWEGHRWAQLGSVPQRYLGDAIESSH